MKVISVLIGAIVIGMFVAKPIIHFTTKETVKAVVTDKERISGKDSSKYLVFTENETFENTDTLLAFKFNSSDVQGKILVGSECSLDVTGFRVPILSMYRNVLSANCNKATAATPRSEAFSPS